jgi:hypothetical protein
MKNTQGKTLEETIKELQRKYKNVPSPLSENYNRNQPVMVPQQRLGTNFHDTILNGFKPTPKTW